MQNPGFIVFYLSIFLIHFQNQTLYLLLFCQLPHLLLSNNLIPFTHIRKFIQENYKSHFIPLAVHIHTHTSCPKSPHL